MKFFYFLLIFILIFLTGCSSILYVLDPDSRNIHECWDGSKVSSISSCPPLPQKFEPIEIPPEPKIARINTGEEQTSEVEITTLAYEDDEIMFTYPSSWTETDDEDLFVIIFPDSYTDENSAYDDGLSIRIERLESNDTQIWRITEDDLPRYEAYHVELIDEVYGSGSTTILSSEVLDVGNDYTGFIIESFTNTLKGTRLMQKSVIIDNGAVYYFLEYSTPNEQDYYEHMKVFDKLTKFFWVKHPNKIQE